MLEDGEEASVGDELEEHEWEVASLWEGCPVPLLKRRSSWSAKAWLGRGVHAVATSKQLRRASSKTCVELSSCEVLLCSIRIRVPKKAR